MKINISLREIVGGEVHWYAISGMSRVDGVTNLLSVPNDNVMDAVIEAEGGYARFKHTISSKFMALDLEKEVGRTYDRNKRSPPTVVGSEKWGSVEDFANWWMMTRPIRVPFDAEIIISDDATGMCLYRDGQFQVELYMSHPGEMVKQHCHPGVQVLLVKLGGGGEGELQPDGGSSVRFRPTPVLEPGNYHGADEVSPSRGYLVFQRWDDWLGTPTSTAIQWKGEPAGPKHEKIINLKERSLDVG